MAGKNKNNSVQVIDRCFAILEEIADNQGEASLAELGRALSIPHSTIHRILSTLLNLGYVEQNQQNGHYKLGLKLLHLSNAVLESLELRSMSQKYLKELMQETGETANLVVLDGDEVVYIEKEESRASVRVFKLIGARAPVHTTGAGKVLLSEMAHIDIIEILRRKGLPSLTPQSIIDSTRFFDELEIVKKQGFALDDEECELGARCIAVPVRNHTGRVIASLSISGPTSRLTNQRIRKLIPIVKDYGGQMSRALGYEEAIMKIK